MSGVITLAGGTFVRPFRARQAFLLEILHLSQQLAVLKRKHPKPPLVAGDGLSWVLARRLWSRWMEALIIVKSETIVRWHRAGFALYWPAIAKARQSIAGSSDWQAI